MSSHLRPDVRFHDGSLLTADDVVVHVRGACSIRRSSAAARAPIARSSAVERSIRETVRFRLKEPFGSFPIQLVMGIVKRGSKNRARRSRSARARTCFVRSVADDRVVLKRFDGYFDGPARNPGLVLKVVPDDTMRGLELRKGTIDVIVNDLAPDIVHELERSGDVKLTTAPGIDYAYVGLNMRDPILADVRVRQALAYAVNRQAIVEHLRRGLALPAVGLLPPMSWADGQAPGCRSSPTTRRKREAAAGRGGLSRSGRRRAAAALALTLKTSTTSSPGCRRRCCSRTGSGSAWRSSCGRTSWRRSSRTSRAGNFRCARCSGWASPIRTCCGACSIPRRCRRWASIAGTSRIREIDALIERATRSTDDAERRALYADVQRRIAEAVPYISLWHKTNVVIARPDVRGVEVSPNADFIFLRNVSKGSAPLAVTER